MCRISCITRSSEINAIDKGIKVLRIVKTSCSSAGYTNSMPAFSANDLRKLRPMYLWFGVLASSVFRILPATVNSTLGNAACGLSCAMAELIKLKFMKPDSTIVGTAAKKNKVNCFDDNDLSDVDKHRFKQST